MQTCSNSLMKDALMSAAAARVGRVPRGGGGGGGAAEVGRGRVECYIFRGATNVKAKDSSTFLEPWR